MFVAIIADFAGNVKAGRLSPKKGKTDPPGRTAASKRARSFNAR